MAKAKSTAPVAQYDPHTRINSESLLKNALLLWDHVDCIVPEGAFVPEASTKSKLLVEAEEILVRSRVPSVEEKRRVHEKVAALIEDGVPKWLRQDLARADFRHTHVYPDKLLHETWQMLEEANLARAVAVDGRSMQVPSSLGLLLMSMLADECAGTTHIKITDRAQSYSWLMAIMTEACGGDFVSTEGANFGRNIDRLVTAAIYAVSTDGIPLKRLIDLRRREQKEKSHDYSNFRRAYLQRIQTYIEQLNVPNRSNPDIGEIHRQYRREMSSDLKDLKRELDLAGAGVVLDSTVMGTAVMAVAGSAITPAVGVIGVGALLLAGSKYRQARRAAFRSHATSWLYLASAASGTHHVRVR